jgi:hypothetical protein
MYYLSFAVVLCCTAGALLWSWDYFRRYQVTRPPIGVFNVKDILLMIASIILVPYLDLVFPLWLVAGLLGLSTLSLLYFACEPILRGRWATWLVVLALLALDGGVTLLSGTSSNGFFAVNNAVLIVVIVGIANFWAQSGMKARDVAILGAFLAVYDFIATSQLPLMSNLITRLAGLPLAPILAWGEGGNALGLGLGDLLFAAVFPLVMRKAFGRSAGVSALVLVLCAIGMVLALPSKGVFPVMVVLGPLMVLHYLYWKGRRGQERTTCQYLQEEPSRQKSNLMLISNDLAGLHML